MQIGKWGRICTAIRDPWLLQTNSRCQNDHQCSIQKSQRQHKLSFPEPQNRGNAHVLTLPHCSRKAKPTQDSASPCCQSNFRGTGGRKLGSEKDVLSEPSSFPSVVILLTLPSQLLQWEVILEGLLYRERWFINSLVNTFNKEGRFWKDNFLHWSIHCRKER